MILPNAQSQTSSDRSTHPHPPARSVYLSVSGLCEKWLPSSPLPPDWHFSYWKSYNKYWVPVTGLRNVWLRFLFITHSNAFVTRWKLIWDIDLSRSFFIWHLHILYICRANIKHVVCLKAKCKKFSAIMRLRIATQGSLHCFHIALPIIDVQCKYCI